ncbi:MAG: SdpI family protein [Planctomycetota bacterium]
MTAPTPGQPSDSTTPAETAAASADGAEPTGYRVTAGLIMRDWPVLLLIAGSAVLGFVAFSQAPAQVPIHWNIHNEADGWGPAWVNTLAPIGVVVLLYLLLLYAPTWDSRMKSRPTAKTDRMFRVLRAAIVVTFVAIHTALCLLTMGVAIDVPNVIRVVIPGLFVMLGMWMPSLEQNGVAGVRTPWTLKNKKVWKKTHHVAGAAFVIAGVVGVVSALLPPEAGFIAFFATLIVAVIVPIVYSGMIYKAEGGPDEPEAPAA